MYTGRRYDPETGLFHYRARAYSPDLGRFLQPDPIGYADSMNLYAYCGNNPVNWIDPLGLCSKGGVIELTEDELLQDLHEYVQDKLINMWRVGDLFGSGGDTEYYGDSRRYKFTYSFRGRTVTRIASGHEINYIGVGAGFKKFHLTPFMPMMAPRLWNMIVHQNMSTENERWFAIWGYVHYNEVNPHMNIHRVFNPDPNVMP
jgi:RHS repeat-associated protein